MAKRATRLAPKLLAETAGVPLHVAATELARESVIKPYGYQRRGVKLVRDNRYTMLEWFRQAGKSTGCGLGINDYMLETEVARLRQQWVLISRSLLQARELSLKVRNIAQAIAEAKKILLPVEYREQGQLEERTFELVWPGGSRVICVSGNPDAAAGYTGNVWWDEVGLTKKARELFGTMFFVASRGGYKVVLTSTPRPGFWNEKWESEERDPHSGWKLDKVTVFEGIADGAPIDADEMRVALRDDLRWRQEALCEHVDDDICWLPWELIMSCTDSRRATVEPPAALDGDVYAGWDVARWHHLSVCVIGMREGAARVVKGLLIMRRMPLPQQVQLVCDTLKRYPNFRRLCIDAGGMGEGPADDCVRSLGSGRVERVKFSQPVKEALAGKGRQAMEDRQVVLPDDDELRADLHSVRRTVTSAGNYRFEGESEGSHADRFWALMLMLEAAYLKKGGGLWLP